MYSVRGQVVFPDGKPLAGGRVEFEWQDPDPHQRVNASGVIDADGNFSFSARAGKHRAIVLPPLVPPRGTAASAQPRILDPRLSNYDESQLQFEVRPDESKNAFKIVVEGP